MLRWGLVVFALVVAVAAPVLAEETLVVMDSTGAVLGPVVSVQVPESNTYGFNRVVFAYRQGTEVTLLQTQSANRIDGMHPAQLWYATGDCSLDPVMVEVDCCAVPEVMPFTLWEWGTIWAVDTATTSSFSTASYRLSGGTPPMECMPQTPASRNGHPIQLWGTISFTPPLSVGLNPVIFTDQFQTGDMSRWSNY